MRIYVKVIPNSRANKIERLAEGDYKVWLTAPPVDGKANQALVEFLSNHFNCPKSLVRIAAGKTSRKKIVDIG